MLYTYKIATININGISSNTKVQLLRQFLLQQDIDIALIQELTSCDLPPLLGFNLITNVGTEKRGTAFIIKEGLSITKVKRIPSGRGIAGLLKDTWIINIYAPSGAENK